MAWRSTITSRVYQFLIWAYPVEFRRRYAAQMASVFEESCADAYRRGTIALVTLCCSTAYDLLITVCAEHVVRFGSNLRSDLKLVSKSPTFAAAFGALAGNLFFIQNVVVAPFVGVRKTAWERLELLTLASVNIAVLWVASQVFLYAVDRKARMQRVILLSSKNRMRSFRRLAGIALILALCPAIGLLISAHSFSMGLSAAAGPATRYWIACPIVLLITIVMVFALQPLLIPRNSESENSPDSGAGAGSCNP
jgi:hypothetical protein